MTTTHNNIQPDKLHTPNGSPRCLEHLADLQDTASNYQSVFSGNLVPPAWASPITAERYLDLAYHSPTPEKLASASATQGFVRKVFSGCPGEVRTGIIGVGDGQLGIASIAGEFGSLYLAEKQLTLVQQGKTAGTIPRTARAYRTTDSFPSGLHVAIFERCAHCLSDKELTRSLNDLLGKLSPNGVILFIEGIDIAPHLLQVLGKNRSLAQRTNDKLLEARGLNPQSLLRNILRGDSAFRLIATASIIDALLFHSQELAERYHNGLDVVFSTYDRFRGLIPDRDPPERHGNASDYIEAMPELLSHLAPFDRRGELIDLNREDDLRLSHLYVLMHVNYLTFYLDLYFAYLEALLDRRFITRRGFHTVVSPAPDFPLSQFTNGTGALALVPPEGSEPELIVSIPYLEARPRRLFAARKKGSRRK